MHYKRRHVREKTLQALYALELSDDSIDHILSHTLEKLNDDKESYKFARTLFQKCIDAQHEIDSLIRAQVANWEFDRIALIDKLLLRMTITELLYFEDIPPKVSINESIEIAKRFSTEKSGKFINGILDAVLDRLKQENRLHKRGRGLVDTPVHTDRDDELNDKKS
jgi:transcription antitermination protein NusB